MQYFSRILLGILSLFFIFTLNPLAVSADWYGSSNPEIPYDTNDLGLKDGVEYVKDGIDGIQTKESFGDYIQRVVVYLLTFISIVAVIYIMWA